MRIEKVNKKKSIYPKVVGQAVLGAAYGRVILWDRALRHLEETQTKQLMPIIRHSEKTAFGRKHAFKNIRTVKDYQRMVPLGDYDSFSPYIDAMRTGERNLLVPEKIEYFGNSSGSSSQGKPKFLPISERQISLQKKAGADLLYRYLAAKGESDITGGYFLALAPPSGMKKEGPVWITNNPALAMQRMPQMAKVLQLPEPDIRAMENYDEKLVRIVERYFDHDVRVVSGTTCWLPILFDKLLEHAKGQGKQVSTVSQIWPNLKLLIGGGVSKDPYLKVIDERMGRTDYTLVDNYNATEGGFYACSDHVSPRGMLMIPDRGVFFEFVPLDDLEREHPRRLCLWEVETDTNYAIHVTTTSGLFSYRLGDIVRFASVNPHRIEFAGRLSGCLSVTQELTTHIEIEHAASAALSKHALRSVDYGCAADVGVSGAKSRYVFFIEFEQTVDRQTQNKFIASFDEALCQENRVYKEHRKDDLGILMPELVVMPKGTVKSYLGESGNVQTKFPRILDDYRKEKLRHHIEASLS